jgi:hypothetical protein
MMSNQFFIFPISIIVEGHDEDSAMEAVHEMIDLTQISYEMTTSPVNSVIRGVSISFKGGYGAFPDMPTEEEITEFVEKHEQGEFFK